MLDPLEPELQLVVSCLMRVLEMNSGPLEGQQALTANPFLQPSPNHRFETVVWGFANVAKLKPNFCEFVLCYMWYF